MTPLAVALKASRLAETILRENFGRVKPGQIYTKRGGSIVTHIDRRCERAIRKIIRRHFPSHAILGEEFGRTGSRRAPLWFIDPLDGTTNYTIGSPFFGTMIAFIENNRPTINVINLPMFRKVYTARLGCGAFRNNRRIRVSRTLSVSDAIVNVGFAHDHAPMRRALRIHAKIFRHVRNVRQFASAAIAFSFFASGQIDATVTPEPSHHWDVATGVLLAKEAGGTLTDLHGKPWTLQTQELLASNGLLHAKLLRLIR